MKKIGKIIVSIFRWMFRLPIKVESFNDFVANAKLAKVQLIIVKTEKGSSDGVFTASVGSIGTFVYYIVCSFVPQKGRAVVFEEKCFSLYGSSHGFVDADERAVAAIKILLLAEKTIQKLQTELPDTQIQCPAPPSHGVYFDKALWKRLHADAAKLKVTV